MHWCALDVDKLEAPLQDTLTVNQTRRWLREAKAKQDADVERGNNKTPFWIGVGFHKPHLPFQYPSTMDDLYPPAAEIAPAKHSNAPKGMPLVAWHEGNFDNHWEKPCSDSGQSKYRRAYYSAVSFTDSNVGEVLGELKSLGLYDSTAVLLIGDHGWQLGEMNLWRKMTNFELGVRVPLLIRVPWKPNSIGVKSPLLVEAVDLFQTLVDVAGLPAPSALEMLEGKSFAEVFDHPTSQTLNQTFQYAFSQFAKRNTKEQEVPSHPEVPWDECTKCTHADILYMGLSVRDENYRYTEWYPWSYPSDRPNWINGTYAVELYSHVGDFGADLDAASATENLAVAQSASQYAQVMKRLSNALKEQFHE
jgi:arylsulfatase A-like enzyme